MRSAERGLCSRAGDGGSDCALGRRDFWLVYSGWVALEPREKAPDRGPYRRVETDSRELNASMKRWEAEVLGKGN